MKFRQSLVKQTACKVEEKGRSGMWKLYEVELHFNTFFASSTPKNPKDVEAMLEARMPATPPDNAVALEELAEQVKEEVGASEEVERGYATFKRDENGLYYEARCIRAHIKDCANILQTLLGIKALKSKVANRVYIEPAKIQMLREGKAIQQPDGNVPSVTTPIGMPELRHVPLDQLKEQPDGSIIREKTEIIKEADGSETRIIHAMTMKGPRSSLKTIDYVDKPVLKFNLKVMDDGVIDEDILESIFEYGGTHGMGQERSQDWGKYNLVKLRKVS